MKKGENERKKNMKEYMKMGKNVKEYMKKERMNERNQS